MITFYKLRFQTKKKAELLRPLDGSTCTPQESKL